MQLRYGGYPFDDNEVSIQIFRRRIYSQRGRQVFTRHTFIITGVKQADTAAELTSKLAALELACLQDGADLRFYDNDGAPTAHGLISSGTINGVQTVGPVQYPGANPGVWGMQTEYVNKRTYRVIFQADYVGADDLVEYQESITKIGTGGPQIIWQESLSGAPQFQQVKAQTKCLLIQQGYAIGLLSRPEPSTPLFPLPFFKSERAMTRIEAPRYQGINISTHWPIHWRYEFESASPL